MAVMSKLGWSFALVTVTATLFAQRASASPPASAYELGVVWERFDVERVNQPIVAKAIRFDTRAWFGRHVYLGGEADWGTLSADSNGPESVLARSEAPGVVTTSVDGQVADAHVIVGTGATAGAFSGGAELATGLRYTTIDGMLDTSVVIEGRGRIDLRLGHAFTVGAVAGVDLRDGHAVSLGLVAGMRFAR